ncbi:MAG TPA: hypothetical protein VLA19_01585 [Herpetosiphonaceae bacterium]|nr:hypothetical protein [Herpetosiphonaceae bacterium]
MEEFDKDIPHNDLLQCAGEVLLDHLAVGDQDRAIDAPCQVVVRHHPGGRALGGEVAEQLENLPGGP